MGILYIAGFDNHGNDAADKERYDVVNSASFGTQTASGHEAGKYGGTGYIQNVHGTGTQFLTLQASETAGRVVFWFREGNDSGVSNNGVLRINSGATNAFFIHAPDGALELRNSSGVVATGSTAIGGSSSSPSQWHHLDVTFDLAGGTCQLVLDGNTEINTSFSPDAASWDNIVFRGATAGFLAGGDYWVRDDVIVEDGTGPVTLDNHRVWHALPSSDTSVQWSRNSGTANFEMVDDTNPDQLTTYVESTAANDRDVYGFVAPNASGTINAVQVKALCTGGGNIRLGLKDGASEDVSANFPVDATLWKEAYYVLELAPDGTAWSQAKLDSSEFVLEADSAGVQVTQLQVEVLSTTTAPATPTLSLDAVEEEGVFLSGSAFIEGSGGTHDASQWEIALATDPTFSSPVYNPGDDGTNLTSINITGLNADTDYIARLRYKETPSGLYSGWSNTVSFTTTFQTGPRYDPIGPGGKITRAGLFWRENDTDTTECSFIQKFYDASKNFVSENSIDWLTTDDNPEGRRKQATTTVPAGSPIRFVNVRVEATGNLGERSGADYMCAWINPPDFDLQANLSLDAATGDVTLEWFTAIDARVSYVFSKTGFATLLETYDHPNYNPTFTNIAPLQTDTQIVGNIGFAERAYVTITAWDNNDKRSSLPIGRRMFNDEFASTTQDPAGATPDVDWSLGPQHTLVLDQNCAPTFSNPVAGQTYTLVIQQDSTGGWTFTWPSSVKISGGSLPTVTSTANAEDVFELYVAGVSPAVYYLTIVCQDCA